MIAWREKRGKERGRGEREGEGRRGEVEREKRGGERRRDDVRSMWYKCLQCMKQPPPQQTVWRTVIKLEVSVPSSD